MQATQQKSYSIEEYLTLEDAAEYKSEYIDGEIIPMAGGSTNHNQIALNISTELNFAFKKLDSHVFIGDVRLWIPQKNIFTYPDVMVIAGEPEYFNNRTDTITNPIAIIEVLSQSTKNYDTGDKFAAYRTIPTFQEYILIDKIQIHIDRYFKTANKRWSLYEYDKEDNAIALESVALQILIEDIYNKVKFSEADNPNQAED